MMKIVTGLIVGVIAGAWLGQYFTSDRSIQSTKTSTVVVEPQQRDIQNVPEVGFEVVDDLRRDRYLSIKTIEDTLALPTDFAETEALYAVAGRSSPAELGELIEQANRIVDRTDRMRALTILLSRLTELDPGSALEYARSVTPDVYSTLENRVWTTWGRLDLDAAVEAAQEVTGVLKQAVVQALYGSVRDANPDKMQLIQTALGVKPGLGVLSRQLYTIADQSMDEAEAFIDQQDSTNRKNLRMVLAQYKQMKETGSAIGVTSPNLFGVGSTAMVEAQADPEKVLEQFLANPGNQKNQMQLYASLQSVLSTDPDKALAYLDEIPGRSNKSRIARYLMPQLAAVDPQQALEWLQDNNLSNDASLLSQIYTQIAQDDPQTAFLEAQTIKNRNTRQQVVSSILRSAIQQDPASAAAMLEQITNVSERRNMINQVSSHWASTDFDQAVQWLATLDSKDQQMAVQGMQQTLAQSDVDNAIRLLEQFPDSNSQFFKSQIAASLVQNQSIDDALAFVSRYQGTPEYDQLQQSVISMALYVDPDRAMQIVETMPEGDQKDQYYFQLVTQKATEDPSGALQSLDTISNPQRRQQAMQMVAMNWFMQDPDGAESWFQGLPAGDDRQAALMAMITSKQQNGEDVLPLVRSLTDPQNRQQMMQATIYTLISQDPEAARQLMSELDLSDTEREQYEQMIQRFENVLNGSSGGMMIQN